MNHQQRSVFTMSRTRMLWQTAGTLLAIIALVIIPAGIAFSDARYPDLSILPIFWVLGIGFVGVIVLLEMKPQTVSIELGETGFTIKKWGSRAVYYPYSAIMSYNERRQFDRSSAYDELTLYMPTNWFMLRSNVFQDYPYLKAQLTQSARPVPYRRVITQTERTQFRWFLGGLSLVIIASIVFGFVAHNPSGKNPAPLGSFTAQLDEVRAVEAKSNFKGVSFRLNRWPDLWFYASRQDFDQDIQFLLRYIRPNRPVTLLLRESDIQKKLLKTQSLTFGDKYIDYKRIEVFGIRQGTDINLSTSQPVREPTRTHPYRWLLFFGMLLVFCGSCWVWVEQQPLIRAS
ncbi:hypothetical protein [Spirosoma spitsbergense]|uniref:hypothetical protein n=1 Tax=Spirosoma spitsbergense TaxID=431554 RepID=UPI0003A58A78|nr:hypothetical protein [Spirosoma spitsbergense]